MTPQLTPVLAFMRIPKRGYKCDELQANLSRYHPVHLSNARKLSFQRSETNPCQFETFLAFCSTLNKLKGEIIQLRLMERCRKNVKICKNALISRAIPF